MKLRKIVLLSGLILSIVSVCSADLRLRQLREEPAVTILREYVLDAQGLWRPANAGSHAPAAHYDGTVYLYDKKSNIIYYTTATGHYCFRPGKEDAKVFKKDKTIPKEKSEVVAQRVEEVNQWLDKRYAELNKQREKEIADSIARERRLARERQVRDSIARAQYAARVREYRGKEPWYQLPKVKDAEVICEECGLSNSTDEIIFLSVNDNKLVYLNNDDYEKYNFTDSLKQSGNRDTTRLPNLYTHIAPAPEKLLTSPEYKLHLDAYPELKERIPYVSTLQASRNRQQLQDDLEAALENWYREHRRKVHQIAPDGYIKNYWWSEQYHFLTFGFKYFNSSYKTIKYIKIKVGLYNPVDDLITTTWFNCTGPLDSFESGVWEWDDTYVYLRGDESYLVPLQVDITYKDGTKRSLRGKKLIVSHEDESE